MNIDIYFREKLKIAHHVKCPVCNAIASFTLTGSDSFTSNYCHPELNLILDKRIYLVFVKGINPDSNQPLDFD
jgi:hypothetical protein